MNFVALKMLTGDRAKYLGLIFAIAFAAFLLEHQISIFAGVVLRTASQIMDVTDVDIWVMDPNTQYVDEIRALTENDLYRVRGVPGVQWAVRLFKGLPRAKAPDGKFRVVILMGLDDATLVGAPGRLVLGSAADLSQPDERELAAATARVGVATADLFPRFSLTGTLGVAATDAGKVFTGAPADFRRSVRRWCGQSLPAVASGPTFAFRKRARRRRSRATSRQCWGRSRKLKTRWSRTARSTRANNGWWRPSMPGRSR